VTGGIDWRIDEHDNGRILARLDQFPEALRDRLREVITQLTHELLAKVEAAEPNLLRPHTHAYVDTGISKRHGGHWIRGRVRVLRDEGTGINYGKIAGALEYGGPGKERLGKRVKVAAHNRSIRSKTVKVGRYTRRQPRLKALRFLRGPALIQLPRARALIAAAIGEALQGNKPT
jgi:hypothetical protein